VDVDDHARAKPMKITEIATLPVAVGGHAGRFGGGYSEGYSEDYRFAVIIVLVRTDEGLTGIGEASLAGQGRGVLGILDHFRELLVGQDPGKIEHWWSEMVRGMFWSTGQVVMSAVAGIDIALWDLKGKALGVPVSSLLGGPTRDRVRVYVHLRGQSPEELVEDGLRRKEAGFTALRFGMLGASLTSWDPQAAIVATIKGTEALRTALGDDVDLLLDAHTMLSPAESAYLGHALEPYRLFFYEDPIRPLNPTSLRLVREKVNLPIATGEQLAHKWEFQPLVEQELVDYLRIDMVHAGGITEAKKILAMGEAHGQRSALHHMSAPVNAVACLHVDAAVPNFGIQEWAELEPLYELFPNAPRASAGYVTPPAGPGLGLEFDEAEALKRPSRDASLPRRYWPDGAAADY
jgi:L-alanine-DL-glutamate epimerase-like enolase superfamily enzyme